MLLSQKRLESALQTARRRALLSFCTILGIGLVAHAIHAPQSSADATETAIMMLGVAGGYLTGVISTLGMVKKEIDPN